MNKSELDTPVIIVDLDIMENNIREMAVLAEEAGVILRPMTKTHKCPAIAHLQLEALATPGIQTAKLGEAEVMAAAGVKDIFISNEIIGHSKVERLMNLAKRHRISVSVDSLEGAQALSVAAQKHNVKLDVLINIDTGNRISGVLPGELALELACEVTKLGGLNFKGIWTHEGHNYLGHTPDEVLAITLKAGEDMVETKNLIERELRVEVYNSVGSTPGAKTLSKMPGIDEIRPGTYVFYDVMQLSTGTCDIMDCAVGLLTTVISRPVPDRIVCDAGTKAYCRDYPMVFTKEGPQAKASLPAIGGGVVKGMNGEVLEDILFHRWAEEYGMLIPYDLSREIKIGDKLEVIPWHVCSTINLYDEIIGVRKGTVEVIWPIAGRGKVK